jgi:hypothetical protein
MAHRKYSRQVTQRPEISFRWNTGATDSTLRDDVQTAFERACSEQDFEVAEYLLRTLEAIARRDADDSSLDRPYRVLAHRPHE